MRKPLIAANWKMNKTAPEAVMFIRKLKRKEMRTDIIICPAFTALHAASKAAGKSHIKIGAQNVHFKENGAYTGEISPLMLKDAGCSFAIIGHSERRAMGESDVIINHKIISALQHNITPIFCVGETLAERTQGETFQVIKHQLAEGFQNVDDIKKLVIAYEPVWAIGTGENATPSQAEEVHAFIRTFIEGRYSKEIAQKIRILYGGSVNPGNIKQLLSRDEIDGALVGGASLDIDSFLKLI